MSIIAWVVLGLIAGFISSKVMNGSGEGSILDIVLGIIGAVVGGFLFNLVGAAGVDGFNIWSLIVATVGAMVVLGLKHALVGGGGRLSRV
ncbi:MAG: GlsB/YeaQ/YmgE family stress response membrane protein [Polyangiaceae bacterium]